MGPGRSVDRGGIEDRPGVDLPSLGAQAAEEARAIALMAGAPTCRALIRITSPSQSTQIDSTYCTWPEVPPLCQCDRRDRE